MQDRWCREAKARTEKAKARMEKAVEKAEVLMATAGGAARTIDFVIAHRIQPTFKGVENPKAKGKAKDGKPKAVAKEMIAEKAKEKVAT